MKYQIELFYADQFGECDSYHAFHAGDPDEHEDFDEVSEKLAEMLDTKADSEDFRCDSMYVDLPDSVVKKIGEDAVRAYIERGCESCG